ncbi:hypothetical protein J6590_002441 [Homalodisca vitripennis]|nr:hypothetical protein J6590_002441 [Homalodisca vitripennis]
MCWGDGSPAHRSPMVTGGRGHHTMAPQGHNVSTSSSSAVKHHRLAGGRENRSWELASSDSGARLKVYLAELCVRLASCQIWLMGNQKVGPSFTLITH